MDEVVAEDTTKIVTKTDSKEIGTLQNLSNFDNKFHEKKYL